MKSLQLQPLLWAFCMVLVTVSMSRADTVKQSGADRKVLIIGIDGCRFDSIEAAATPNLDLILRRSAWSRKTAVLPPHHDDQGISIMTTHAPGWATVLTGVWHPTHGFLSESTTPVTASVSKNFYHHPDRSVLDGQTYPTLFERLQNADPEFYTASLSTWEPLNPTFAGRSDIQRDYSQPGRSPYLADQRVSDDFCSLLGQERSPDLSFLLFSQVNEEGQRGGYGPESHAYLAAVERVDGIIGQILKSISDRVQDNKEEWLILITSDHGGDGLHHTYGFRNPHIDTTFLIAFGPTIPAGEIERATSLVDIAALSLDHLGFSLDSLQPPIDGVLLPSAQITPQEIATNYTESIEKSFKSLEAQFELLDDLRKPLLIESESLAKEKNDVHADRLATFSHQIQQLENAAFDHHRVEVDFLQKTYRFSLMVIIPVFLLTIIGLVIGELIHGKCLEKATLFIAQGFSTRNPLEMVKSKSIEEQLSEEDDFSWIEEQEAALLMSESESMGRGRSALKASQPGVRKWNLPKKSADAPAS